MAGLSRTICTGSRWYPCVVADLAHSHIVMGMPNTPLFLEAIETTPNAVAKLSALAVKLATLRQIYTRAPTVDPLDNPEFGPTRSGENTAKGRNIGRLAGGLGGMALGGLAGHAVGGGVLSGAAHVGDAIGRPIGEMLGTYDPNMASSVHDNMTNAGKIEGTISGAALGGLAGHAAGGAIGAGIGRLSQQFSSPEAQAAERIKKMDPATGLAHIRMMEQSGHASPSVLQAMKDTYETRRRGLGTQIQSGVPIPPGTTVQKIDYNRRSVPF
jgi:hypothetical protein